MGWRIFARPGLILAAFAALTFFFALQIPRFEINASANTLISEDNELFIRSQEVNQLFAPEEFLLIAYRPDDGRIFSPTSLRDIEEISERVAQLPRVQTVRSVLNVPLLSQAIGLSTDLEPEKYTQQKLRLSEAELKKLFKSHPVYSGLVVNVEQTASGIQVLFKPDPQLTDLDREILRLQSLQLRQSPSDDERRTLQRLREQVALLEKQLRETRNREIAQVREILQSYEDDADLFLGGVHALSYQLIDIIKNDLVVFGSIIAVVICLMLLLLFRRWQWLLITFLCCACSLVITIGVFGLLGLNATVISANFISLQLILSLAIVVHLIVQYREIASEGGQTSQRERVMQTLRRKLAPCFFAGFTTSVGFASLLLSDIKPVSSFGWMMVAAMTVTLLCTLLLFPSLLLLTRKLDDKSSAMLFKAPVLALQKLCQNHPTMVIWLSAVLLLASAVGALRLDVENSFIDYFSEDSQVHRELSFIDLEFGGSTPLDVVYSPPLQKVDNQLVLRAIDVQNVHRIQDELDALPAMGTTLSVVNLTRLARQLNNDKPLTEYELTSIYRILDEDVRKDLVGSFFVESPPQLRISARVRDSYEGLDREQFLTTIHERIQALGISPDQYQLSNLFILYQAMLQQLFDSQILTLGAVFIALTLAFWLIFRSLRIALVAMLPNVVCPIAILGFMGWFRIPLDFMTITIAAISMGIAVDDTIHYTHRYLEEVGAGAGESALANSHQSVGYAMVYTTSIIVVGFSLLVFSDFEPSVLFGVLTALALLLALIADLTLLPVLLRCVTRSESGKLRPASQSD